MRSSTGPQPEPDPDRQVATYQEAQTLLMNDAPILPLRFGVTSFAIKPYVSGVTPTLSDFRVPGDYFYETIQIARALASPLGTLFGRVTNEFTLD